MNARSWIRLALIYLLLILSACAAPASTPTPTPIPTILAANSETRVDFAPGSAARLYSFTAASATRLKLDSRTPGFSFNAEIRDGVGKTVAAFGSQLQDVLVTLAPVSGFYQIAVSSADPVKVGTVSLALGSAVIAPPTLDGTALRAVDCRVANAAGVDAIVRSAPAAQYAILGLLAPDGTLPVIGHTDDDAWYTVDFAERRGWMRGDVIALDGDCAALPVVRNPTIPDAPADAEAFLVQVDRDASGTFRQAISTPQGDTSDLVWVRIVNLDSNPPNNYREFALTLDCEGTGIAAVRWGSAYSPSLTCGATVVVPFLNTHAQQPIRVEFPPGSRQSYVEYTLSVLPADTVV